jgi:hypothetical protein
MNVDQLYQEYQNELRKLVQINEKSDFSEQGEREFQRQRNRVDTAKYRLIFAERKNRVVRS